MELKEGYFVKAINSHGQEFCWGPRFRPIDRCVVGYNTLEKAVRSARRYRLLDIKDYPKIKTNYYIVTANNEIVRVVAEDMF